MTNADLAADIGCTVTDLAIEFDGRLYVQGADDAGYARRHITASNAIREGPTPADCDLIIYDTTMATNALTESKGARPQRSQPKEWATRSKSPTKVGSNYFREPSTRMTGRGPRGNMGHADPPFGRGLSTH